MSTIPPLAFKIAAQLIEEQLLPQATEAADVPQDGAATPWDGTALSLLRQPNPIATTTEPAPKVVTDTGSKLR